MFPQQCILPTLTPEQHVQEVHCELFESIQKLLKQVKKKFLQKVAKALETISNDTSEQRVMNKTSEGEHDSEDERVFQRANAPPVTMTTNPTNSKTLFTKPCTHVCVTRNNTPGSLPVIINPEHQRCIPRRSQRLAKPNEEPILTINTPNSTRIPLHLPNIIAFNAVNKLMGAVYYGEQKVWYPGTFLRSSPNRHLLITIVILNTCVLE